MNTYKIGTHRGRPFILGEIPIVPVPAFGLVPGDRIIQVGRFAKSGKETSSSRISDYPKDNPAIYRGVVENVGLPGKQMVFAYTENGVTYNFLYTMLQIGRYKELIAVDPFRMNVLFHVAVFKKVGRGLSGVSF